MTLLEQDIATIRRDATRRRSLERLVRIDDMRAADRLRHEGTTQREIAELLRTTQPRVHRMLRAIDALRAEIDVEELIVRVAVDNGNREDLVRALSSTEFTFTEYAPDGAEGSIPGTWGQVRSAFFDGLLSEEEYERVKAAINPPERG